MVLTHTYIGNSGVAYRFEYHDANSFTHLPPNKCTQSYAVCFYDNQMVIVHNGKKDTWGLIGGTIEKGETFEEALFREIKEESNMEMLKCLPVGYQKVIAVTDGSYFYQLRYVATARPYGPFISDPGGSISEIACILPKDYKQYFDWNKIGDRIIERAISLLPTILES
jgi:hypothetical protein